MKKATKDMKKHTKKRNIKTVVAKPEGMRVAKLVDYMIALLKASSMSTDNKEESESHVGKQPKVSPTLLGEDYVWLAGVQYSQYKTLPRKCFIPGISLNLRLEKNNPHDPNAIAVCIGTTRIGYIPRGAVKDKMINLRGVADIKAHLMEHYPNRIYNSIKVGIKYKQDIKEEAF